MTLNEIICPICGRPFPYSGRNRKYCSLQCQRRASLTEHRYEEIKDRGKGSAFRRNLAMYFSQRCAVCGWQIPKGFQHGCEFHHVIPVCEGGPDDNTNLVLLCPNCHAKAHAVILTRKDLLKYTLDDKRIEDIKFKAALDTASIIDKLF